MLDVRRWAEIRRMKEVEGLSIHEIARRTGHDRNTVRRALRREGPPRYQRPPRPSKLDPFKDEIYRLLQADPRIPGKRIRELIEELGFDGGKTILDDYLRELRPLFERRRTYQRTIYRPGERVYLGMIARNGWLGDLKPLPVGDSLRIRVAAFTEGSDPDIVRDTIVRLNRFGTAADSFKLAK